MDTNRRYYGYNRARGKSFKDKDSVISSKAAANMLVQMMVCVIILLSMLYVRYNSNAVFDTVSAYTVKILAEDIDYAKVYTDSKEFWVKLFVTDTDAAKATAETSASSAPTVAAEGAADANAVKDETAAEGTAVESLEMTDTQEGDTNIQTVE